MVKNMGEKMNALIRKIMMIISIILMGAIIFFVIKNIINDFATDYIVQYIFNIIFAFSVGTFIVVKTHYSKKIFLNNEFSYLNKIAFALTGIFVITIYLIGIFIFIYETFYEAQIEFGGILGIAAAIYIYNYALNILQKKAEIESKYDKTKEKEETMYNAQIIYKFKEKKVEEGIKIWKEGVYNKIIKAEGFIRVQLYTNENEIMAIGTWEDKSYADSFMKTGVFKDVMGMFDGMLQERPINSTLELRYFETKK